MKKHWLPSLALGLALASATVSVQAQAFTPTPTPGQTYQFMQLSVVEGAPGYLSFSPEFNGQKVVKLEDVYMNQLFGDKMRLKLQANEEAVMRALQQASGAGWELIQVSSESLKQVDEREIVQTRYLFRKVK